MEMFSSPLFWLIIILVLIIVVLAGELGRYMAKTRYYEEHFYDYYNKWYKLNKFSYESWWISKDLYFKNYSPEIIKKKTDAIFFNLNACYGDEDD